MTKLIFAIVLMLPIGSYAAVNIPLTVSEALPASVTGMDRTAEIVTGGIPLPEDSGITSVSQLGLSGASAGQFRVLGRWPNGNIKWVLLDFPATVTAGSTASVTMTDGTGNFGGSNLAVDNGTTITVTTGAATYTIKKANFNIFDTVTVGSTQMVTTGNSGRLSMIGIDNVDYSSANDASSTAVIEENGPVRTVIKATGSFKSAGGTRLMDYTLRLHFYKGKATVKGSSELRNANASYNTNQPFKSVEAIVPTVSLGSSKSVTFGITGTPTTTALGAGETAYLFQGYDTLRITYPPDLGYQSGYYWKPPVPGSGGDRYTFDPNYIGVKVQVGSTAVNAFGTVTQYGNSTGSMDDSTGQGVTVGYRWLASYWPGGFELKDNGSVSVELYSKQNPYDPAWPIYMPFGAHDRRTILWDFHTTGGNANNTALSWQLEYPLMVRAGFSQYTASKALYGQSEFPTAAEESSFFTGISQYATAPSTANPAFNTLYREWEGGTGGGFNQLNEPVGQLITWLRTGGAGWFLLSEQRTIFNTTTAYPRSDGAASFPAATNPMYADRMLSGTTDWEHMHIASSPLYYYLTGDEYVKEGILDLNDNIAFSNWYPLYPLPASKYLRAFAWKIQLASLGFEHSCEIGSCDSNVKTLLETAIGFQLDSRDGGGYGTAYFGRSMDRGYLYWEDPDEKIFGGQSLRHEHSIYDYLYFDGLWQTWRVMKSGFWNYSRLYDVEDYMTGLSQFYYKEWIKSTPINNTAWTQQHWPYSLQYNILLDAVTPVDANDGAFTAYDFARPAVWGFTHTNDADFLTKGANLAWATPRAGLHSEWELQVQHLIHTYNNPSAVPTWQTLPVTAQDNGGGSYTLSWTVPAEASQIRIKHSAKQIVAWLGFNPDTRAYQFDPAVYAPYFAATNTAQHTPATPGTVQIETVTGLPEGLVSANFAAKYTTEVYQAPQVINGTCGSSNGGTFASPPTTYLCSSGTPSPVTGTYVWSCTGSNGGTDASCSASQSGGISQVISWIRGKIRGGNIR